MVLLIEPMNHRILVAVVSLEVVALVVPLVLVLRSVLMMLLELFQMDHSILVHCIQVFVVLMDVQVHLEPHKSAVRRVQHDD